MRGSFGGDSKSNEKITLKDSLEDNHSLNKNQISKSNRPTPQQSQNSNANVYLFPSNNNIDENLRSSNDRNYAAADSVRVKIPQNPTNSHSSNSQTQLDKNQENIDSIMLDSIAENRFRLYDTPNENSFKITTLSNNEREKRKIQQDEVIPQKAQKIQQVDENEENISEEVKTQKAWRLFLVLGTFALCFVVFILAVYAKIIAKPPNMDPYNKKSRDYPWSVKADVDIAMRGQISSLDNYILATSKKLYRVSIYVPSIYEEKRELLFQLLHLYADFDIKSLRDSIEKGGNALIATNVNSIDAANLRILNQKLARLGVYKKCTFTYINKTSLQDGEIKTLYARAQVTHEKGSQTPLDIEVLQTMQSFENGDITEENTLEKLNVLLVEYKNKDIDLSKECYTPIFTHNSDVKNNASTRIDRGLDIAVEKIERTYPFKNLMQPLLGFTNYGKKIINDKMYDDKMKLVAQSGVEKYRDGILSPKRDGKILGMADKGGNIILNRHAKTYERTDGFQVQLTIPLTLQSKIQDILNDAHKKYKAEQIVAGIMDPTTGEILALASSSSFNPNIGKRDKDIASKMRVAAAERSFEPGSTIKPLVFAYLANKKWINFQENFDLHDGIYQLRTYTIRDSTPLKSATAEQILIKSSNIGMTKLTRNLSGKQMQDMFQAFGIGESTGIDIANEATGLLPKPSILNREVEKGTASYGYGLRMTFIQLLRSYAPFNNGGFLVTPHVTKHFIAPDSKIFYPSIESPRQIISAENAAYMQKILHRVVKEGTGKRADVAGLIVGGKTGTARERKDGETIYNGSFFGYASDSKKTYTIGVVTYGSQANEDYYAGQTAAPVFAKIADLLAQEGYLERK